MSKERENLQYLLKTGLNAGEIVVNKTDYGLWIVLDGVKDKKNITEYATVKCRCLKTGSENTLNFWEIYLPENFEESSCMMFLTNQQRKDYIAGKLSFTKNYIDQSVRRVMLAAAGGKGCF